SRQERTKYTAVGDGEGTAGHFFDAQLAITSAQTEITNSVFDSRQAHVFGVAQYRHHQTFIRGNRHTNVLVAMINNVIVINRRIDCGEATQSLNSGFNKETHEAQTSTVMRFLKLVFVFSTQLHDGSHVHFVERG